MQIAILGGGSFGTTIAIHLNKNGHQVKVWEFVKTQAAYMQENRHSPMMSNIPIPQEIFIDSEFENVIPGSDMIVVVVPSDKVETTIEHAKQFITNQKIVICSKGFGPKQKLLQEVVQEILPNNEVYCLYGPTIAAELALHLPAGMVLAGTSENIHDVREAFANHHLKVETTTDIVGVQVASALKNVVTILVGIVEGADLGENAKALAFVMGISEIADLGVKLGAQRETFYGLCGMGDLLLNSRNRKLGIELGRGRKLKDILAESDHVLEGLLALENAHNLADKVDHELQVMKKLKQFINSEIEVHSLLA